MTQLTSNQASVLVPPSLLRIRQFLAESGLKVRPWESPEVILEELRQVLEDNRACPGFWHALEVLLAALTEDIKRTEQLSGQAVAVSVFPEKARAALLSELKQALDQQALDQQTLTGSLGGGAFRALSGSLSGSAVVALCLLAGVALTGCSGRVDDESGAGGSTSGGGGNGGIEGGVLLPSSGGTGGGTDRPECREDPDGLGGLGGAAAFDTSAIEAVLSDCELESSVARATMDVVDTMNQCWRSGVRGVLEASTCEEVERHVARMMDCDRFGGFVGVDYTQGEFSLEEFLDYCSVAVYRGVAFD